MSLYQVENHFSHYNKLLKSLQLRECKVFFLYLQEVFTSINQTVGYEMERLMNEEHTEKNIFKGTSDVNFIFNTNNNTNVNYNMKKNKNDNSNIYAPIHLSGL